VGRAGGIDAVQLRRPFWLLWRWRSPLLMGNGKGGSGAGSWDFFGSGMRSPIPQGFRQEFPLSRSLKYRGKKSFGDKLVQSL